MTMTHLTSAADTLHPRVPGLFMTEELRLLNHANTHVRGFKEEGTTTTPFDIVMVNDLDRYHVVITEWTWPHEGGLPA